MANEIKAVCDGPKPGCPICDMIIEAGYWPNHYGAISTSSECISEPGLAISEPGLAISEVSNG